MPYTIVPQRTHFSAQADASGRSLPATCWAKVVICVADGEPIQAVIPAPLIVNLEWLSALAGASSIRFALDEESRTWFSDCEPDAMPPLGPLYGQRVFVDPRWRRSSTWSSMRVHTGKRFGCDTWILRR